MPKYDICCLGHITLDKVITPQRTVYMPGGTSFYFSHAIRHFQDVDYLLITSLGESEMPVVEELRNLGVAVQASTSGKSVYFENIYGENQDNRTQRVLAKADPFALHQVQNVDATYFHLGALLADDFPLQMLKELSQRGLVSVDAQGYLREVLEQQVHAIDWHNKPEALRYIHTLKVNEQEMEILTGSADIRTAARQLYDWGVREVLITLGSLGSVIYNGEEFYPIPAYRPTQVTDATGCGDTYTIGYLYQRARGKSIDEAGRFAAAMATLKIAHNGPFAGTISDVEAVMKNATYAIPDF